MTKITFLGTGTSQGVPMIGCKCEVCLSKDHRDKRLRSSVLVETPKAKIVIDAGPDFRYQMLRADINSIDAILFTHEHKDHTGGLDDVRAFNYILSRPIDVYARDSVIEVIKKDYDYAFSMKKYPGVPEIEIHSITQDPFYIKQQKIIPINGRHYKIDVFGYRIDNMCYITDMNSIDDVEISKIKNIDTLIINALRHQKHISHFNLAEALEIIKKVSPRVAYLTHMSHQIGLHEKESKLLPDNVFFSYDNLILNI